MKALWNCGFVLLLAGIMLLTSCRQGNRTQEGEPVVKAGDYYLYKKDIRKILPANYTAEDSIDKAEAYIEHWLKNRVALLKAENKLSKEEQDVEKLLDNYKMKLLIHRYKQKIIDERLDTNLTEQVLSEYYKKNQKEFLVNGPYFKGVIAILPTGLNNLPQFRNALKNYSAEDSAFVEKYAYQHIENYRDYRFGWFDLERLKFEMPINITSTDNFLKYKKFLEQQDSLHHYFIKVKEYRQQGELAPFEMVKNDIRDIIINKRKTELIRNLEHDLYQNALNSKKIKYFEQE